MTVTQYNKISPHVVPGVKTTFLYLFGGGKSKTEIQNSIKFCFPENGPKKYQIDVLGHFGHPASRKGGHGNSLVYAKN